MSRILLYGAPRDACVPASAGDGGAAQRGLDDMTIRALTNAAAGLNEPAEDPGSALRVSKTLLQEAVLLINRLQVTAAAERLRVAILVEELATRPPP